MGSGGTTALRPPGKFCFIRPLLRSDLICIRLKIFSHPPKQLRRCKVKPHGSLVPVSSTHRCAYTPGLSTSSSSTFLLYALRLMISWIASTIFGVHYSLRNFRICQTVLRRRLPIKSTFRLFNSCCSPAGCNCLLKTQHCANTKVDVYGVTPARCRKVN